MAESEVQPATASGCKRCIAAGDPKTFTGGNGHGGVSGAFNFDAGLPPLNSDAR
jgi:hypothetical protein